MTSAPTVHKLQSKSHDTPDEVRSPDKTRVDIVRLEGFTIGRFTFQPGWRWSQCIKPVVKTDSCQAAHVGYAVSGRLTVRLNDGSQTTITPGMSYTIPARPRRLGGRQRAFVGIEVMSAEQYAKS
jgi:quercetin dioxygenase-like cupin family protein